ncbi:tetratricopeptide repeat protein [Nitratireductor sp. GCM10026969]|uniref:tetratricopeptide repeat protein n=1 Tax=Nitratireductor sp. GCM10026969 TaxID=3252645 RepID=UPI003672E06B
MKATAAAAALMMFSVEAGLARPDAETIGIAPVHSFSGAYLAGRAAEFENDLDTAIAYYQRAIAFDPENGALQQSLLRTLVLQGRLDEALPYARKLQSEPEMERFSRLVLAIDSFRSEDYAEAERWLKLVLESDIDRLVTGTMTAWAKLGQGDLDGALAHIDGMEGPNWYGPFTDYQRALMLAEGGREAEAKEAFEVFFNNLVLQPVVPDRFGRMAEAYAAYLSSLGEDEQALEVVERALESGGGIASVQELRDRLAAGETLKPVVTSAADGAAEVLLDMATELASSGGEAFLSFAQLYLQQAFALRPDNDAILVQLARLAERQQESARAIGYYEQIDASSPWARFADFQIGLNMADLDRHEQAIEHLESALDADPSDMRAYLALGGVYAAQEDYAAAARVYDRAVARIDEPRREDWNLFYRRGIAYERLKEWEKAEPNFKTALELYPDQPQVLNYLGYSWVDMNMNLEEAMDLIRRAVELRPSDGFIVDSLGWAHYRLGEYEEAVEQLERAVSLRPQDPVLNDHLGDAYWRVGRKLEARFQWAHARDLEPEPELLAEVETKLAEGLPPEEGDKLADAAGNARTVVPGAGQKPADEDAEAAAAELYTVQPGQTLWSIATEELGDGSRYHDILELNPVLGGDPNRIRPGLELKLPANDR